MCLNIPHCKQWLLSELCETGESMSQRQPYFVYDGDSAKYALAAIAFTSGTTAGGPKGIPITVEHRMNTLRKYSQNYETSRVATEVSIVFTNMSYHTTRDELLFLMLEFLKCNRVVSTGIQTVTVFGVIYSIWYYILVVTQGWY